jgi:8-oxo-dGTP pyrophosphatase MutT (NUDIX family)
VAGERVPAFVLESDDDALAREVAEECGAVVAGVGGSVCTVLERRPDVDGRSVFEMTTRYREATVTGERVGQRLDAYEAELGMRPVWTTPAEALAANAAVAAGWSAPAHWLLREITVLAHLLTIGDVAG